MAVVSYEGTLKAVADIQSSAASDATLLARTAAGDHQAFADLYTRHAPWVLARLTRRCGDAGLVEEALQDTFVAVWRSAQKWEGRGEVAGWIWGIAIRRMVDALRRVPPHAAELCELPDDAGPPEPSAEDRVLDGTEFGSLGAAVADLPTDLRAVVRATIVDGLTSREAAVVLGIPAGTVKTRLMRARNLLKAVLA